MLRFCCVSEAELQALRRQGLLAAGADGHVLYASLDAARAACDAHLLVVDTAALEEAPDPARLAEGGEVPVPALPKEAIRNLDPYRAPGPVAAAGGYVVRANGREPEVLLIFRRGVWDLPKGKRDPGEALETCALREVREEVGISRLHLARALGTTVHGYAEEDAFRIKTTHWYLMWTPERRFAPQAEEDIEQVAWVPWSEAKRRIGYRTLREHMEQVESRVFEAVPALPGGDTPPSAS